MADASDTYADRVRRTAARDLAELMHEREDAVVAVGCAIIGKAVSPVLGTCDVDGDTVPAVVYEVHDVLTRADRAWIAENELCFLDGIGASAIWYGTRSTQVAFVATLDG